MYLRLGLANSLMPSGFRTAINFSSVSPHAHNVLRPGVLESVTRNRIKFGDDQVHAK